MTEKTLKELKDEWDAAWAAYEAAYDYLDARSAFDAALVAHEAKFAHRKALDAYFEALKAQEKSDD